MLERFRLGECTAEGVGINWAAELFNGTDEKPGLVGLFVEFKIAGLVLDGAIKTGENELLFGTAVFCWFWDGTAVGCWAGGCEVIKTYC